MRVRLAVVFFALVSSAAAQPLFLNILPPGQDGFVDSSFTLGTHALDQLPLYRNLILEAPDLTDADLTRFFKDASIAAPASPERVEMPRLGVTISRDAYGVPHVVGVTRSDVFFGAGYVTAEDRLFLADALRHIGRGRFSEFGGSILGLDATIGLDRTYAIHAGYSEEELQAQIAAAADSSALGARVLADVTDFVAGINAYIAEARMDANKLPAEYLALPLEDWTVSDVLACTISFTTVIGFGNGGGGEDRNAALLAALQGKLGEKQGRLLWQDLRAGEDPAAPVTTRKRFPYMQVSARDVDPAAVVLPDAGSIVRTDPFNGGASAGVRPAFAFPTRMSNWLGVTGAKAAGKVPILVGGPQTGYFAPQALIELSLEGGGINVRGAAVPGTPYVVLGHTPHYAFTATAGGSDLTDVRVERLCTPEGGVPSSGTIFNGECRPMYRRVDMWTAAGTDITATIERTVHGPVIGRATVNGEPVVLAAERSSFMRELESGAAFVQLNEDLATTPEAFRDVMATCNSTLNWLYVSHDHAAYFHSGRYPIRAPGVDPDLPSWGTGQFEWQGFLPATQQPFEVDPKRGFAVSWNNKPARGWRAADDNYAYGPVYRSLALEVRLQRAVKRGKATPADVVNAMGDAATVDLRGQVLLADAVALARGDAALKPAVDLLRAWARTGAHRRDRDQDGSYDDAAAVALMDAWYPRLLHAVFDPQLGDVYGLIPLGFDDAPSNNIGSAYQGAWYGHLQKALRQGRGRRVPSRYRVLRCGGGSRGSCAKAVRDSLTAAVAELTETFGSSSPEAWTTDPRRDDIHSSIGGAIGLLGLIPNFPWQNRPTFQQVVQIR